LASRYNLSAEDLRAECKKWLTWGKHYRAHKGHGYAFSREGAAILDEKLGPHGDPGRDEPYVEDKWVWATVCSTLPPNRRHVWIAVPGVEGKCVCNLPTRFSDNFRVPGRRLPVRHVDENVYQIVVPAWSDFVEDRVI